MARAVPALALAAALIGGAAVAQPAPTQLPLDGAGSVSGIQVGCTGIGQSKNDPRWLAYSLRVEFADRRREYLANGALSVSDASGRRLVSLACDGPWILLKLPRGSYRVEGWIPSDPRIARQRATVQTPARGQTRFVLQFPDP